MSLEVGDLVRYKRQTFWEHRKFGVVVSFYTWADTSKYVQVLWNTGETYLELTDYLEVIK